jgi:exopolyphosphatase/guanosine-5'-triphosphate,3'-diphosphate pyrophosphatase
MEIYNVEHYRACATSAMRDAKNGKHIIDTVKKEANINIEIISGDEEATLIYENHVC